MEENIQNKSQPSQSQPQGQKKNTGMAILAYIIFFIPLLTDSKKDPFVKYHVKQGLLLFIGWVAIAIISSFLPWYLMLIVRLLNLALFILMIIGIISASKGEQKPLPLIGQFAKKFKF